MSEALGMTRCHKYITNTCWREIHTWLTVSDSIKNHGICCHFMRLIQPKNYERDFDFSLEDSLDLDLALLFFSTDFSLDFSFFALLLLDLSFLGVLLLLLLLDSFLPLDLIPYSLFLIPPGPGPWPLLSSSPWPAPASPVPRPWSLSPSLPWRPAQFDNMCEKCFFSEWRASVEDNLGNSNDKSIPKYLERDLDRPRPPPLPLERDLLLLRPRPPPNLHFCLDQTETNTIRLYTIVDIKISVKISNWKTCVVKLDLLN